MTRVEWVLRRCGIERLYFAGIVTNGGVASTVRDARCASSTAPFSTICGAFSDATHRAALEGLWSIARIITLAQAMDVIW
jgi:ureidoacrylate peracid hydrolase